MSETPFQNRDPEIFSTIILNGQQWRYVGLSQFLMCQRIRVLFSWHRFKQELIARCWFIWYRQSTGVIAATLLGSRLSFVWDFASDGLVALSLKGHHPAWACVTAMIMLLPYAALSTLLAPSGLYRTLGIVHPRLKEPLQRLAAKRSLSAIFCVLFACPGFPYMGVCQNSPHLV